MLPTFHLDPLPPHFPPPSLRQPSSQAFFCLHHQPLSSKPHRCLSLFFLFLLPPQPLPRSNSQRIPANLLFNNPFDGVSILVTIHTSVVRSLYQQHVHSNRRFSRPTREKGRPKEKKGEPPTTDRRPHCLALIVSTGRPIHHLPSCHCFFSAAFRSWLLSKAGQSRKCNLLAAPCQSAGQSPEDAV